MNTNRKGAITRLSKIILDDTTEISNIIAGSIVIDKAICKADELTFGGCIASRFAIEVYGNIPDTFTTLKYVQIDEEGTSSTIFEGYTDSITSENEASSKIVAYNYFIKDVNVSEWYKSLFSDESSSIMLSTFLTSLLNYLGFTPDFELKNDFSVTQTFQSSIISAIDLLRWACELQGGFGYLEGKTFKIGYLEDERNLLPFPYYSKTQTNYGITCTVNDDGSVTVDGTNTKNSTFQFSLAHAKYKVFKIKGNTDYVISGCDSGNENTYGIYGALYDEDVKVYPNTQFFVTTKPATVRYEKDSRLHLYIYVKAGATVNNVTFYPEIKHKLEPLEVMSGFTKSKFKANKIDKVQLRTTEDDIGAIAGTGTNALIIQGNPLLYGKSAEELAPIAENLYNSVKDIEYVPFTASVQTSDINLDLFKKYTVTSSNDSIDTYVFDTSYTGSQLVNQTISAEGVETRSEIVDDTNAELYILSQKTTEIKKDVDGITTKITVIDGDMTYTNQRLEGAMSEIQRIGLQANETEAKESVLEQTVDGFTKTFITIDDSKQVTDSLQEQVGEVTKITAYIRETADGIEIGKSDSEYIAKLKSDRLEFANRNDPNNPVAYFSNNQMVITHAVVNDSLDLGNFRFNKETDGSLSFMHK